MTDGNLAENEEMYSTWILLGQTRHVAYRTRDQELRPYGIGPRQGALLHIIHVLGNRATPSEIARTACLEDHTISANINTLVKNGLVRRVSDLRRRNMVRVELTEKGLEAFERSMRLESVRGIMSCLSGEEREQFRALLNRILKRSIEVLGDQQKPPFSHLLRDDDTGLQH